MGAPASEGVRGRGMHIASITHEEMLAGRNTMYYCEPHFSIESNNKCTWTRDVNESKATVATKKGEMDLVGLNDNLSLLLLNNTSTVMVYDIAATGALWNPGIQLMNCAKTDGCSQIAVYDYQQVFYEDEATGKKEMSFTFMQKFGGEIIIYDALIEDFAIAETAAMDPIISISNTFAKMRDGDFDNAPSVKKRPSAAIVTTPNRGGPQDSRADAIAERKARRKANEEKESTAVTGGAGKTRPAVVAYTAPQNTLVNPYGTCNSGERWSAREDMCVKIVKATPSPKPTQPKNEGDCLPGYYWDKRIADCREVKTTPIPTKTKAPVTPTQPKNEGECLPGWTWSKYKNDCIYTPTVKLTGTAVPNTTIGLKINPKRDCSYGNITPVNKEHCSLLLPKCSPSIPDKNCSANTTAGFTYADSKKCVRGGSKIVSCCPANTTLQNGKCVEYPEAVCEYGKMKDGERKTCEAKIQDCDVEGIGLECDYLELKRASMQKCLSGHDGDEKRIVWSCCAVGYTPNAQNVCVKKLL
jgi:hypothetical protein